jgi:hypothetical protein
MRTKITIILIICTNLFIYCACGGSEKADDKGTGTDSTAKKANVKGTDVKRSVKDARNIGGDKSTAQLSIDAAMKDIENATDPIIGYWVGAFGNNRINLVLSEINGTTIKGHSVCAGNYRPITGTIELTRSQPHKVTMTEPGDDKYDGKFDFVVDLDKMKIKGNWAPYKEVNGTKAKDFTLEKKNYTYDPSVGEYPQASQRLLTEEDVENYTSDELEVMRNEIYARHGYSFKNRKMRAYFEAKDWYIPVGVDIRSQLTDDEVKNIALIYRYEEYYKVNYDDYGR